ncbi:unnamed protein product [marine sediment metagenome]|uniref:Membrane-bound PQQ-dependent dehydrogenase, glucose/quinate/shikimate family n=1 Tax=marine sediment metagenome TaxID=412755 RepID=X1MFR3_9ZZZZ
MAITLTALLFLIIAAALGAGGVWLAVLGGSWYYVIAALAFLVTSILLFRRRSAALPVYALLVIGTLGWAIWEIRFDWWQLAPRGGVIILLGLWLLTPWVRGRLTRADNGSASLGAAPLWLAVLVALGVAGYSMTRDPLDLPGQLSREAVTATPDIGGVPNDDIEFAALAVGKGAGIALGDFLRAEALVLPAVDHQRELLGRPAFVVEPFGLNDLLDQADDIIRVENGEIRAQADQFRMAAQQLDADGVERAEPGHAFHGTADENADALLHLARRLVGEGHRKNLAGIGLAEGEDVGDA